MSGALTHTRITWALSPMMPQVPGVTHGSRLCPWCCKISSSRGAQQLPCICLNESDSKLYLNFRFVEGKIHKQLTKHIDLQRQAI